MADPGHGEVMVERMKIAPIGPERNIQIAKLKGYKHIHNNAYMGKNINASMLFFPHWSTNRNDAWELEKEMVDDGVGIQLRYGRHISNGEYYVHLAFNGKMFTVTRKTLDEAIADCVSQAWITWKEGK